MTLKTMIPRTAAMLGMITATLVASPTAARQAGDLPAAEDLIARYVQAIGGRDAFLAIRSLRTTGTLEIPAMGMSGRLEVLQAQPNLMTMRTEIQGLGTSRDGFDGEIGWSLDAVSGPRIVEGEELVQRRDESHVLSTLRDPELRASAETIERTEIGGRACFKVRIVWKSGRQTYDCYDVEDGLLVGSVSRVVTPMGEIEVTAVVSDYREFGPVRMPTRVVQQFMGQEFVMQFTDVVFDDVDPAAFELPDAVRALLEGDDDETGTT